MGRNWNILEKIGIFSIQIGIFLKKLEFFLEKNGIFLRQKKKRVDCLPQKGPRIDPDLAPDLHIIPQLFCLINFFA